MARKSRLRIHGHGEVELWLIASYLDDLANAYNGILTFESEMDRMAGADRLYPAEFSYPRWIINRRNRYFQSLGPVEISLATRIPISEQLVLSKVHLSSPGFWEFLGTLNPLEVTRRYINDRHERRKDKAYRESAEARRLALENLVLENEALSGRIKLARELGATDRDLAPLLNELVYRPLNKLDRYQDSGIIDYSELIGEE